MLLTLSPSPTSVPVQCLRSTRTYRSIPLRRWVLRSLCSRSDDTYSSYQLCTALTWQRELSLSAQCSPRSVALEASSQAFSVSTVPWAGTKNSLPLIFSMTQLRTRCPTSWDSTAAWRRSTACDDRTLLKVKQNNLNSALLIFNFTAHHFVLLESLLLTSAPTLPHVSRCLL